MRLLVSVRDASEARAALVGGADIVDAKEPTAGALGAVTGNVLAAIADVLHPTVPISVALGDFADAAPLAAAISALPLDRRSAPVYAKFALRAMDAATARRLFRAAVEASEAHPAQPRLVAATYADAAAAGAVAPVTLLQAAAGTGIHGLLLDTWAKDGRTLLDHLPGDFLGAWVHAVRTEGCLAALAGSLGTAHVPLLLRFGADVLGVRGAACAGGRTGGVEPARVRALRTAMNAMVPVGATA
jgi:uncharacterized protein (UPF0264 family)